LTGGVASGKSTAAELLTAFGADLIDFDELARQALEPQTPGWEAAAALFGPKMVRPDQTLDRLKIASLIFKKPLLRAELENIIHPRTWELMIQRLKDLEASPLIIIDVPLLFEANLQSLFSPVIVCFCPSDLQYRRLRARDPHKSRRLAKKMILSQMPMAEKVRLGTFIINNNGSLRSLIRQTKRIWLDLTGRAE
jgi:dephospho-CoA kinase